MNKIDAVDQAILSILTQNARASISDIGRQVHKSRTAVEARIARLEREKVILGYSVVLDELAEQRQGTNIAFLTVKHAGEMNCSKAWAKLRQFPNVIECYAIFGATDMIIKARYSHLDQLMTLKNALTLDNTISDVTINPVIKCWSKSESNIELDPV